MFNCRMSKLAEERESLKARGSIGSRAKQPIARERELIGSRTSMQPIMRERELIGSRT
jgi:hypothetical protein